MTTHSTQAKKIFRNGFNCAQAVLSAFAPQLGLPERDALRVAGAFGAGMGRMGKVCGAVTGAFMVLGLVSAKTEEGEDDQKERLYERVLAFTNRFTEQHGSIDCKALLGVDLSTEEGFSTARDKGLFDSHCSVFVEDAARILDALLEKTSPAPESRP